MPGHVLFRLEFETKYLSSGMAVKWGKPVTANVNQYLTLCYGIWLPWWQEPRGFASVGRTTAHAQMCISNTWSMRWHTPSGPGRSGRILQSPTSKNFGGGTQVAKTIAANVFPDGNQWCKYRVLVSHTVDNETSGCLETYFIPEPLKHFFAGAKLPVSARIVMWAKCICQSSNAHNLLNNPAVLWFFYWL